MKVMPTGTNVLIKLDPIQERTMPDSGLVIQEKHAERFRIGTVLEAGEDSKFEKDERIAIAFWSGIIVYLLELGWHNDAHRIIDENEIVATILEE